MSNYFVVFFIKDGDNKVTHGAHFQDFNGSSFDLALKIRSGNSVLHSEILEDGEKGVKISFTNGDGDSTSEYNIFDQDIEGINTPYAVIFSPEIFLFDVIVNEEDYLEVLNMLTRDGEVQEDGGFLVHDSGEVVYLELV